MEIGVTTKYRCIDCDQDVSEWRPPSGIGPVYVGMGDVRLGVCRANADGRHTLREIAKAPDYAMDPRD